MNEPVRITEAEVRALVDLPAAIAAVREVLALEHAGEARTMEKTSVAWPGGDLHAVGGVAPGFGLVGTKTWAHTPAGASPQLLLWNSETGALAALIDAFTLGKLRTAAITAVATDALARPGAAVVAMIGTGKQARTQVEAVHAVRPLRSVRLYSPTPAHRDACATALRADLGVDVSVCSALADAVAGADIVTTATRAREPFLAAASLDGRVHVNAIGAITPERQELHLDVAALASVVAADSPTAATTLSHELDKAADVVALSSIVAGATAGRPGAVTGITLFKAMGLGLADLAVGRAALLAAQGASS